MNYLDLINIKYTFKISLIIFLIFFTLIISYVLNLNIYENFTSYGYVLDDQINLKVLVDNPDILNNLKYIKIGSKDYKAEVKEISEVMLDSENFINYQIVKLKIDERLNDNEVFKVDIFYNEEKVYKKLKKILF